MMKIKTLTLTNFRCFDSLTIHFEGRLNVLVAQDGAGKSAVLDAISIGIGSFLTALPNVSGINFKDTDFRIQEDGGKPPYMRIAMTTVEGICWDRTKKRDKFKRTAKEIPETKGIKPINEYAESLINDFINGRNPRFPIIAYYGTGRGVFDSPQRRRSFKKDFAVNDGYRGALEAKANFKSFFEYFYSMEDLERREKEERRDWDYRQKELVAIRTAITRLMPEFSNPRTAVRPIGFLIDWERDHKSQTLRIEQLSDGYRTTLAMVMDIASRMAWLNPTADDILDTEGIVLIDEIDLHLHPFWQQTILPDLLKTFPGVQFIVSTHSPQVLTTARREQVRVLGQSAEGKFFAEPPLGKTYAEESNNVLQAVMGVNPIPPLDIAKVLEEYTKLVEQGDYLNEAAQEKKRQLENELGSNHPQLQKLERSIRRMEVLNQ